MSPTKELPRFATHLRTLISLLAGETPVEEIEQRCEPAAKEEDNRKPAIQRIAAAQKLELLGKGETSYSTVLETAINPKRMYELAQKRHPEKAKELMDSQPGWEEPNPEGRIRTDQLIMAHALIYNLIEQLKKEYVPKYITLSPNFKPGDIPKGTLTPDGVKLLQRPTMTAEEFQKDTLAEKDWSKLTAPLEIVGKCKLPHYQIKFWSHHLHFAHNVSLESAYGPTTLTGAFGGQLKATGASLIRHVNVTVNGRDQDGWAAHLDYCQQLETIEGHFAGAINAGGCVKLKNFDAQIENGVNTRSKPKRTLKAQLRECVSLLPNPKLLGEEYATSPEYKLATRRFMAEQRLAQPDKTYFEI